MHVTQYSRLSLLKDFMPVEGTGQKVGTLARYLAGM